MKLSLGLVAGIGALLVMLSGCAPRAAQRASRSAGPGDPKGAPPTATGDARATFEAALAAFVRHDEAHDWTPATCAAVAAMFDEASALAGGVAEATFDAGLAHQRCRNHASARTRFEKAARENPLFHAAQAKLALYRYEEDGDADAAIDGLQRAVAGGKFTDVAALVDLAALQMVRDGVAPGVGCNDDMDCAKLNLHRALALDDRYMPAHNELALYYLRIARKRAGHSHRATLAGRGLTPSRAAKRADVQQLELAALVCSQAIAKAPHYAPIHNTAGLVEHELGRVNSAIAELARAVELDPRSFEAQMNYAASSLGIRAYERAATAYRRAIEVRPNDYDAHLGLAVALRGSITDEPNEDALGAKLDAVAEEIEAAKRIDESRPEAFFNEGLLFYEVGTMRTRGRRDETLAMLARAERSFQTFLEKVKGKTGYEDAIARASERLTDIMPTRHFLQLVPAPPAPPQSRSVP